VSVRFSFPVLLLSPGQLSTVPTAVGIHVPASDALSVFFSTVDVGARC